MIVEVHLYAQTTRRRNAQHAVFRRAGLCKKSHTYVPVRSTSALFMPDVRASEITSRLHSLHLSNGARLELRTMLHPTHPRFTKVNMSGVRAYSFLLRAQQSVMKRWLPLSEAVLRMVVERGPSPKEAQATRVKVLWPPVEEDEAALAMGRGGGEETDGGSDARIL